MPKPLKVLIFSYYWPPAGGPGVQRWLYFAKYLAEFGVQPTLVVPQGAQYPQIDEALVAEIPADVRVQRVPISEPYRWISWLFPQSTKNLTRGIVPTKPSHIQRFMLWIRGNFWVPDARVGWVTKAVRWANNQPDLIEYDWVITTGPPHSVHLIGAALSKKHALKWLADFRDPWTGIHYHNKLRLLPYALKKHQSLEQMVCQRADLLVATSPSTAISLDLLAGKQKTHCITNGYEPLAQPPSQLRNPEGFVMAHIGALLEERNPSGLWAAIAELVKESPEFAAGFSLKLIGHVAPSVSAAIAAHKVQPWVTEQGYMPHHEARIAQWSVDVLLLVEASQPWASEIIPGKFFEYLETQKPILALGPDRWDVHQILSQTDSGFYAESTDVTRIKSLIRKLWQHHMDGQPATRPTGIDGYTRQNRTHQLATLLHEFTL